VKDRGKIQRSIRKDQKMAQNIPILHYLDWERKFIVATNAFQFEVETMLLQEFREKKRDVEFVAKSLTKGQRNYSAVKRELLAIIYMLKR
jgi:hypothetical protein